MRRYSPLLAQARANPLPDPFKILAVPKNASAKEIKQAYFALVKKHHPDRPASTKPRGFDFKDIVAAYDLLRDPVKRHQYTNYGMGWGDAPRTSPRPDMGFNYADAHNPWKRKDGTQSKYRHAYQRPRYPSSNWDYGHSDSTEFYSSNNHPSNSENTSGMYTSNAAFVSVLAAMSAILYSVQYWRLAPPMPSNSSASFPQALMAGDPMEAPIYKQSSMMRGRDKHHEEASRALGTARENARKHGNARREELRRRVRENALEAVEAGNTGTGHVSMGETDEEGPDTTNDKSLAKSVREESEEKEFVNPHKYVRQHVPPAERSLKKPAYRNDTPSQAAFFSKRSDNETMARPSEGESS